MAAELTIPACIGCGAMGRPGRCETGCREHRLDVVAAAEHNAVAARAAAAQTRAARLLGVVADLAATPTAHPSAAQRYRALQARARDALRASPELSGEADDEVEVHTTWWCPRCDGIDAPQPCIGVCVWRPAQWVKLADHETVRAQLEAARREEPELLALVRRIASITPREGGAERTLAALARQARGLLPPGMLAA